MVRKTYGVDATELSTVITVGNQQMRITFQGGVYSGLSRIKARFSTTDKGIQDAIEADARYGNEIVLENLIEISDNKPVERKGRVTVYKTITRVQDAKNILVTKHAVDLSKLSNKSAIKQEAEKVNVSFPNMK